MVSLASPEDPSMRLFSFESSRIRSSLAARAVSSSFTFALRTEFYMVGACGKVGDEGRGKRG